MSVFLTCAIAWLLFGYTNYSVEKLKKTDPEKKFDKAVLLKTSFSSYLKKFFLIAAICYSLLCLLVILVNILPNYTHNEFLAGKMLASLSGAKAFHEAFDGTWKQVSLVMLAFFVLVTLYRTHRNNISQLMQNLVNKYNLEELEELEDTEEMEKLKLTIIAAEKEMQKLNRLQPIDEAKFYEIEVKKEKLREEISVNYRALQRADFLRRIELAVDQKKRPFNQNHWWNKIALFFTSAGMFYTVKGVEKLLSTASTCFLFFALLTVQSGQLEGATRGGQMELEAVVVGNKINQLNSRFAAKLKKDPTALSNNEKQTIADFSKALEREIVKSYVSDSANITKQQNFYFASAATREQVLHRFVDHKKKIGDLHVYHATEPFRDVIIHGASPTEASSARGFQTEADPARTSGKFTEKIADDLTYIVERLPKEEQASVLKRMKTFLKSFQKPVAISDVLDMAFEHLYDPTLGDGAKDLLSRLMGDDEVAGKIFNQAGAAGISKLFNNSFEYKSKSFMASLVFDNQSVNAAIDKIHHFNINLSSTIPDQVKTIYEKTDLEATVTNIMTQIDKAPATITYNYLSGSQAKTIAERLNDFAQTQSTLFFDTEVAKLKLSSEELDHVSQHAYEFKKIYADQLKNTYSNGLSAYEDYFPNHIAAEGGTVYAREVKPVLVTATENNVASASSEVFNDAFNFLSLMGNQRIGGVLIGRAPENQAYHSLDLRQLVWSKSNSTISLMVFDAKGQRYTLGDFDSDVLAQAIAYAADGRPIATTMITIAEQIPLKIMVHPSLANTPLGCKIINLDRFVDTYAASNKTGPIPKSLDLYNYENVLYNAAAYFVIAKRKLADDSTKSMADAGLIHYANLVLFHYRAMKFALKNGSIINDSLYCPMRYKKAYYNQKLVDLLVFNLADDHITDGVKFLETIEQQLPQDLQASDLEITDAQVWSGVREKPYNLTEAMDAIKYTKGQDPFTTLSFIEQVAYKSSIFSSRFSSNDLHPERDSKPWEFLYLKKEKLIEREINGNLMIGSNQETMDKAVEFTLLQRLFRNAFQGNLGLQFPVNRLGDLFNSCLSNVDYVKTPEWSSSYQRYETFLRKKNPGFLQLVNILGVNNKENTNACH